MAKAKKQSVSAEELLEKSMVPEEEKPYEVPENWDFFFFTQLIDVQGGTQPPKSQFIDEYKEGYVRLVQIRDFASDKYIVYVPAKKGLRYFSENDILIARYGASLGRICTGLSGVYNVALAKVIYPQNILHNKYVFWMLQSEYFQGPLMQISRTAQAGFNKEDLSRFIMPLPPLPEQQRIVERIESLFDKLDQAKELAQNALDSFETRKAAILHKAFTGELTAKWREEHGVGMDSWERNPIKEYVSKLIQGWSPKCEPYPSESDDTWGVIKTTAIQHMQFNDKENKQLPSNLEPKKQHELQEGDILITRAGPRIRVGVCCLVKYVRPRLLLCDKAYRFNALVEKTLPEFLVYQLNRPSILDEINRMKTGISDSGVNLTQEGFLSVEIVMPSLPEQKEVVRLLDGFLERKQRVNELIDVIDKIEYMKKAILARAFRGELGANNPSEESAIGLLKEVMTQQ